MIKCVKLDYVPRLCYFPTEDTKWAQPYVYICMNSTDMFKIVYKKDKPNGTMRKVLDVSLAKRHGWKYKTSLKKGLSITVEDYLKKFSDK